MKTHLEIELELKLVEKNHAHGDAYSEGKIAALKWILEDHLKMKSKEETEARLGEVIALRQRCQRTLHQSRLIELDREMHILMWVLNMEEKD